MNSYGTSVVSDHGLVRRKPKKITIRQRLVSWLTKSDDFEEEFYPREGMVLPKHSTQFGVEPMQLNIYRAAGGYVVETRVSVQNQNSHSRDFDYRLHIVKDTDGTTLGEELSKILTMETLRN
jgi:hypothetical protein